MRAYVLLHIRESPTGAAVVTPVPFAELAYRPDRSEELARVVVETPAAADAARETDPGAVARVYEEGRRRVVRDPRTGVRESHVVQILEEGKIDGFLIAALQNWREPTLSNIGG